MSNSITFPDLIRLDGLAVGPQEETWQWDGSEEEITIFGQRSAPSFIEPVGVAMLASWARFQALRGRQIRIDDSFKGSSTWKSGLLSAMVGRTYKGTPLAGMLPATRLISEAEMEERSHGLVERLFIPDLATAEV